MFQYNTDEICFSGIFFFSCFWGHFFNAFYQLNLEEFDLVV
jgi:hypothetical protein